MTEITLTRAALERWANSKTGWQCGKCGRNYEAHTYHTDPPDYLPDEAKKIFEGEWFHACETPGSFELVYAPDPTTDIAAAWALWEWATNMETQSELRWMTNTPPMTVLMLAFQREDKLWAMSAQELATWICCTVYTVYEAVKGVRVTVLEESK